LAGADISSRMEKLLAAEKTKDRALCISIARSILDTIDVERFKHLASLLHNKIGSAMLFSDASGSSNNDTEVIYHLEEAIRLSPDANDHSMLSTHYNLSTLFSKPSFDTPEARAAKQ
jgi:hypothetical protein